MPMHPHAAYWLHIRRLTGTGRRRARWSRGGGPGARRWPGSNVRRQDEPPTALSALEAAGPAPRDLAIRWPAAPRPPFR